MIKKIIIAIVAIAIIAAIAGLTIYAVTEMRSIGDVIEDIENVQDPNKTPSGEQTESGDVSDVPDDTPVVPDTPVDPDVGDDDRDKDFGVCHHEYAAFHFESPYLEPVLYYERYMLSPNTLPLPDNYSKYTQGCKFTFLYGDSTCGFYIFTSDNCMWDIYSLDDQSLGQAGLDSNGSGTVSIKLQSITVTEIIYEGQNPNNNFISWYSLSYEIVLCQKCGAAYVG